MLVALDEIKLHLGVEHSEDDELLTQLEAQVSAWVKRYLKREVYAGDTPPAFSEQQGGGKPYLVLSNPPVVEVLEVKDTMLGEVVSPDRYELDSRLGLIWSADRSNWGSGLLRWKVVYKGGLPITPDLKLAVVQMVGRLYFDRVGSGSVGTKGLEIDSDFGVISGPVKEVLDNYILLRVF